MATKTAIIIGAGPAGLTAAYELITRAGLTHERPPYGIDSVRVGNREVAVHEEAVQVTPFATLLHFKKDTDVAQPPVLMAAPLARASHHPLARALAEAAGPGVVATGVVEHAGDGVDAIAAVLQCANQQRKRKTKGKPNAHVKQRLRRTPNRQPAHHHWGGCIGKN